MMLKNWYSAHHLKRVQGNRERAERAPAPSNDTTVLDPHHQKEIAKMMRSTWMSVIQKPKARELFLEQNEELVAQKKMEIQAEPDNRAFAGGLQSAAASRAWDECEEKEKYEELANSPAVVEEYVYLTQRSRCPH